MDHELAVCQEVAREAGELLLEMQPDIVAREKGPADLVTDADLASQFLIRQRLKTEFPQFGFVGEEDAQPSSGKDGEGGYYWLVDPLDGTTNYAHGLDNYAVSIALCSPNGVQVGAVFDPVRNELFVAARGHGAWRNGQPISPSRTARLSEALVVTSFAARVPPGSPEVERFLKVLYRCQAIRRLGSAALNLCYVACGRLDAYWASSVKSWDIAAASLMLTEAGGELTHLSGSPFTLDDPQFLAAATPALHRELLEVLGE